MPALRRSRLIAERRSVLPVLAAVCVWLLLPGALPAAADQIRLSEDTFAPARARFDAVRALREGRYADVLRITAPIGDDPDMLLVRGRALVATGRYEEALPPLETAARLVPLGEAQLALGELHLLVGRTAPAREQLEPLVAAAARSSDGHVLGLAARAAARLGRYEQANALFRDAAAFIGDNADLQLAWGELFLEKHNRPEAVQSFRAALQRDRRNAAAFAGIARAFADENADAARQLAMRALAYNPALAAAHLVLADIALDEDRRDEARASVEAVLAVNDRHPDALARQAAMAFLDDRLGDFEAIVARVLAINPRFGDVYRIAGAQAARHYRFEAAARLVRRALEIEPGNVRAQADLGLHLLRTGDEAGARRALEAAFQADPYDVVSYNLLGLLDTLDAFETVEDGLVTLRLHPDEAPVLREHALLLARRALDTLAARYDVALEGPILVEIFPRHDDFAVRNVGLPGMVGALGACFGKVVTLDSPRARPPGSFNWQATLWHEMAHVVTLQLSDNRIPRWLTEGISVYEEKRARPEWGREMEARFADALERGEVLPLADLNRGFMSGDTIALAYYQASLLVEHLVATRGHDALRDLVRAFADGLSTDEAMRRVIGPTLAELEPEFRASIAERFAAVLAASRTPDDVRLNARTPRRVLEALAREHPDSYEVLLRLGERRALDGDTAGAYEAWERAARVLP
jgi:tetratricopeptide (TPR) repeat protein